MIIFPTARSNLSPPLTNSRLIPAWWGNYLFLISTVKLQNWPNLQYRFVVILTKTVIITISFCHFQFTSCELVSQHISNDKPFSNLFLQYWVWPQLSLQVWVWIDGWWINLIHSFSSDLISWNLKMVFFVRWSCKDHTGIESSVISPWHDISWISLWLSSQ